MGATSIRPCSLALACAIFMMQGLPILGKSPKVIDKIKAADGQALVVERLLAEQGIIWGFDFIDSKQLLFTERSGQLKHFHLGTSKLTTIKNSPKVFHAGQGGLLDVLLHPNFKNNQVLYLSYSIAVGSKNSTRVSQYRLQDDKLQLIKHIVSSKPPSNRGLHFGSRLVINQKGYLFVSIGDRGYRDHAQDLSTHSGKILRYKLDGSIPKDNPFVGKKGALPEIWTYGHRNPQGLAVSPFDQKIWEQEHGPRGGDEINILQAGRNYGWPVITYGREYHGPKIGEGTKKKGMEQPVKVYVPSIAPSGLTFYSSKKIPSWYGDLFSGALVLQHINRLDLKKNQVVGEERLMKKLNQRIRNVKQGPDGALYFSTDGGSILRIRAQ